MLKTTLLALLTSAPLTFAAPGEISGTVTAAKNVTLKNGGVLFVIARKAGSPMPVAVVRVTEPKLPYKFKMSGKDAMSPGTPFEGPFSIVARFSPSGDALDKSGPEAVSEKPVAVGATDLKLELKAK